MGRTARSWELTTQSYRVLMQDKELLLLPLLSGGVMLGICATFVFGLSLHEEQALRRDELEVLLPLLLMYVLSYTAAFFFQAALVAGASQRLAGGDPTISSALAAASRRFGAGGRRHRRVILAAPAVIPKQHAALDAAPAGRLGCRV